MARSMSTSSSVKLKLLIIVLIVASIGAAVGTLLYFTRDRSPIPAELRTELTFSPLIIPSDSTDITSRDFALAPTEDGETQLLTYTIANESADIVVSQYPQPQEFVEIPEYKERFLNNVVRQEQVVQTANGTIHIGTLAKGDQGQIGVMLERGLIVFMKPEKSLGQNEWRRVGEALLLQEAE